MKDKRYIVINGPIRKRMGTMMLGGLIAEPYRYRNGDLGLLHPSIISFFENKSKSYIHKEDDIPVLLYNGHLLNCGSPPHPQKRKEYIIVPLKENEFTYIRGTSLGKVREELREFYKKEGLKVFSYPVSMESPEKALEKTIREQWKKLVLFNPNKNLIYEIPIESSRRSISLEEVKRLEKLNEILYEIKQWERQSYPRDDTFISAIA